MKKKAGVAKVKLEELADAAHEVVLKDPPRKPCLENFSAASQALVGLASMKPGICSTCRWASGCNHCHGGKALRYYLKTE